MSLPLALPNPPPVSCQDLAAERAAEAKVLVVRYDQQANTCSCTGLGVGYLSRMTDNLHAFVVVPYSLAAIPWTQASQSGVIIRYSWWFASSERRDICSNAGRRVEQGAAPSDVALERVCFSPLKLPCFFGFHRCGLGDAGEALRKGFGECPQNFKQPRLPVLKPLP